MMTLGLPHFIQLSSCLFMTGVIWIVQVLVYPNFLLVDGQGFQRFHRFHQSRITYVVAPVMILELASGIWISISQPSVITYANLFSIILLWALTAFVAVPLHNQLELNQPGSKDDLIHRNWPRTWIWTVRSLFWIAAGIGLLPGAIG